MYKNPNFAPFAIIIILAGSLHIGTIIKKKDAILETQTESISVAERDERDSKAAPTPSFVYYGKSQFLTDSPMKTPAEKEEVSEQPAQGEEVLDKKKSDEEDWWIDGKSDEAAESDTPKAQDSKDLPKTKDSEEDDDWWVEDKADTSSKVGTSKT